MIYKDYKIEPDGIWDSFKFVHVDYDGPEDHRLGGGNSIQDCMRKIDEIISEEVVTLFMVKMNGRLYRNYMHDHSEAESFSKFWEGELLTETI